MGRRICRSADGRRLSGGLSRIHIFSEIPGVQHACGHDGHTAMLLTAAKLLQAHLETLEGTVLLCFERGEEATMNIYHIMKALEKAGVEPDSVFGLHVSPHTPAGTLQIQAGPLMAWMFSFHVRLQGRGGHGSLSLIHILQARYSETEMEKEER